MQGIRTKYDAKNGVVRYLDYDTEEGVNIQLDDPIVLQKDGSNYLRMQLVDGDLVYNRWGCGGWSSIDEPLTQGQFLQIVSNNSMSVGQDIATLSVSDASGSCGQSCIIPL